MQLTRTHRILIGVVVAGAVVIAGIGFAGSYAAVRELAEEKGFGDFSVVFPIGVDAGICVLLALDLLLTWLRIPFPLLRQTAWLLTAATIAFNAAAAWPDPLGVGMHAVIPVLFVVAVEAARHAVGRIADITADKHMEGVRLTRWLLSPVPTFKLWRRMKLWELRSYEQVIKLEQERLVYQARLQARFGRGWRRKAPVESLMPLRLARYGVPLAETAPAGLAAAGIDPVLLPPAPQTSQVSQVSMTKAPEAESPQHPQLTAAPEPEQAPAPSPAQPPQSDPDPEPEPEQSAPPEEALPIANHASPWFAAHNASYAPVAPYDEWYAEQERQQAPDGPPHAQEEQQPFPVPNGAGGTRPLGDGAEQQPQLPFQGPAQDQAPVQGPAPAPAPTDEDLYQVFRHSIEGEGMPTPGAFAANAEAAFGLRLQSRELNNYMDRFTARLENELMEDHIA
ncbi:MULTISPECIES: DUF2637 domain-containing protein [Streptomyces]|uniref:DUF2637 domain-containing protein n=2 Tax=Streptomyces TaxID=1883 RepID=A0A5P2BMH6_STRVZ|nr:MULTISPECIES: DUF2637 domain-containing protein [Streptomyces]MYY85867.1 DUF2637 domain-containing protein [Streptomyces sp. SID335]NDZ90094.1 DUF2637 domain-containing protein [Streptomyces sp. SID10115]NEB45794.1 DUF2637 domain-containing protein [Streptomyces sp. SID339]QES31655.1 hypothetical protein DEJ47_21560 [Streptomyces venezuelae]